MPVKKTVKTHTTADMVIIDADILTFRGNSHAEALAVKDGKIIYIGDDDTAEKFIGPETEIIDADGRFLLPGFIDNHTHLLWMAMLRPLIVDLYDCKSLEEVRKKILAHSKANPALPLIIGFGWRYELVENRIPKQSLLDEWLPGRHVWMLAYDAETLWTNTITHQYMLKKNPKACKRMEPETDVITGNPTGIFLLTHSFDPFEFYPVENFGSEVKSKMFASACKAIQEALKAGVTAFDELQVYKSFIPLMLEFRDTGGLDNIRARAAYYVDPTDIKDEKQLISDLKWWKETGEKYSDDRLTLGTALKLYIDGVSGNHTAFMREPYSDAPGVYGHPAWTHENFNRLMEIADDLELQTCTHCVGDAGISYILNAVENSMNRGKKWDARHRIEHCELPDKAEIKKMAQLGIQASMQPAQFYGDESTEKALGLKRLKIMDPWRSLEKAGVVISFGTDYIAGHIPPVNPMYGLIIATTRMNYKNNTDWGEDEKIDIKNAIKHYTLGSAKSLKIDHITGSIEVGKSADFVLWKTNLLKISSIWFLLTHDIEIGKIDDFVDMTFVRGKLAYSV